MTMELQRIAEVARRRLVSHLAKGTTDLAPTVVTNGVAAYIDSQRFANECQKIFLGRPLIVGLSSEVAKPGDGLLVEELGKSIIIIRGQDGILRAFMNMCRHRGTRLLSGGTGTLCSKRQKFVCPFHGWAYRLDGQLASVPGRTGFDGFRLDNHNLIDVPVCEEFGLIFLRLSPGEPIQARELVSGLCDELDDLALERMERLSSSSLEAQCNWKLAIDTYAESYHFGVLHAKSMNNAYVGNVSAFDLHGLNWRVWFPERTLEDLIGISETKWPVVQPSGVLFVFPNTVLVLGSDSAGFPLIRLFSIYPGENVHTTRCRISAYVDPRSDLLLSEPKIGNDATSEITREDYSVAVAAQANYKSAPADFRIVYGRNEPGVQAFHRAVQEILSD